jgi:hypothetical protein
MEVVEVLALVSGKVEEELLAADTEKFISLTH